MRNHTRNDKYRFYPQTIAEILAMARAHKEYDLFIGLVFGRNFVQSLHLKWVSMFLAIFFLLLNLHVRMYVGCTVKYSFGSFSGSSNLSPKLR